MMLHRMVQPIQTVGSQIYRVVAKVDGPVLYHGATGYVPDIPIITMHRSSALVVQRRAI